MMAHASKKKAMTSIKEVGRKGLYFTDNYYTRHTLGNHLKDFTDEEARLIGTCKTGVMDSANLENVRVAVTKMSKNDVKRNSWILVRAYDKPVKNNHTGPRSRENNRLAQKKM